jgi:hypothetical protein
MNKDIGVLVPIIPSQGPFPAGVEPTCDEVRAERQNRDVIRRRAIAFRERLVAAGVSVVGGKQNASAE